MVLPVFLCLIFGLSPTLFAKPAEIDFKVKFTGVSGLDIEDKLKRASALTGDDKKEVTSVAALRRAAENDLSRLEAVMRSEGYYTPEIDFELRAENGAFRLNFTVTPGLKFRITDYVVNYVDTVEDGRPATLTEAGLKPDGSPRGEDIAALQKGFLTYLHDNGFPSARIAERSVRAVPATGEATLRLAVETGPRAVYGNVEWSGLDRTERDYMEGFVPWARGQQVKLKMLTEFRDTLARTGLFSSVNVEPGTPDAQGYTPVKAQVTERPPRTVGAGASYSTNLGPGGRVFWEHRNLFGAAENLHLELNGALVKQNAVISFRKPLSGERGAWFTRLQGGYEDSDAFEGTAITLRSGYERKAGKRWTLSAAGEVEWSDIDDTFGQRTSTLGAVPLRAVYDGTDDVLNPTKGARIAAQITPYAGESDGMFYFTTLDLKASGHVPLDEDATYVASMWSRVGSALGASIANIPANRRFYAGGAGSVRGYGYQLLSPLDENNDPIGGRSVLEGGVEFRVKFTKSIGMVTFVEAGSAFESSLPGTGDEIRIGAGVGFRYYTAIGPVRLDVAVPLERRENVDDAFQIYISLGQAF